MRRRGFLQRAIAAGAAGVAGAAGARVDGVLALLDPAPGAGPPLAGLKLNQNENPLGMSPLAQRAIAERISLASRYPGELRRELTARLAALHDVHTDSIVLGNGSTEVIRMAVQAVVARNGRVIAAEPTYGDVATYSRPFARDVAGVPLRGDHSHDIGRMLAVARGESGPVLLYICNPHNPTGSLTPTSEITAAVAAGETGRAILLDEAYDEYVDDPAYRSFARAAARQPNVLVLRTFSKIHGMAGLRIGYGIAHPDTAAAVRAFSAVLNLNQLGLAAAIASLEDRAFTERSRRENRAAREILYGGLRELGLDYIPSHTNFVMHCVSGELATYIARMSGRDVQVGRPFPPMLQYNRISIGTADEMGRFVDVLRDFRRSGWI